MIVGKIPAAGLAASRRLIVQRSALPAERQRSGRLQPPLAREQQQRSVPVVQSDRVPQEARILDHRLLQRSCRYCVGCTVYPSRSTTLNVYADPSGNLPLVAWPSAAPSRFS